MERVVVDVTEASKHGCEATARDDFIRAHVPGWHDSARVQNGVFSPVPRVSFRGMVLHLHEIIYLRIINKKDV